MNLIVNADKNWGIGKNNELLVHIPNDMKMFRQMTTGKVVVMGRKTLESFPNGMPLPKRTNIVLTHDKDYDAKGAIVVGSKEELLDELEEYKDEVTYWFTFNEVWPIATNQYIEGTFPPCITYDITKAVKSMHGMMVAHAKAVCAYKEKGYKGKIGIIHSLETKYPLNENDPKDVYAAKKEDVLANQFLLDATFLGYYTDETIKIINELVHINNGKFEYDPTDIEIMKKAAKDNDYLGMNHYQSHFIKAYEGENEIHHNGTGEKGTKKFKLKGVGERVFKEGIPTTDWDWLIYPEGMYDMIMRIKNQYPNYKAIYITENGMGYKDHFDNGNIDDSPRIDYIKQHLQWLLKSIEDGANVKGYFVWSLMDVFSWSNGYNKRYGLFYVDYDTQERYPKKSAYWYKKVIETREV